MFFKSCPGLVCVLNLTQNINKKLEELSTN